MSFWASLCSGAEWETLGVGLGVSDITFQTAFGGCPHPRSQSTAWVAWSAPPRLGCPGVTVRHGDSSCPQSCPPWPLQGCPPWQGGMGGDGHRGGWDPGQLSICASLLQAGVLAASVTWDPDPN